MDIRDLMYLEASAAAGNFTRAAKSLQIDYVHDKSPRGTI